MIHEKCGGQLIAICTERHIHSDGQEYTWVDYMCAKCGAWGEPANAGEMRIPPMPCFYISPRGSISNIKIDVKDSTSA